MGSNNYGNTYQYFIGNFNSTIHALPFTISWLRKVTFVNLRSSYGRYAKRFRYTINCRMSLSILVTRIFIWRVINHVKIHVHFLVTKESLHLTTWRSFVGLVSIAHFVNDNVSRIKARVLIPVNTKRYCLLCKDFRHTSFLLIITLPQFRM